MRKIAYLIMTAILLFVCTISPVTAAESADGDVNLDGTFNISDVVMFQKYLLAAQTITKEQAAHADCLGDGTLNCFDLVVMKRMLITKMEDDSMVSIRLYVGNSSFTAKLYQNKTTAAFLEHLPLTLDMSELHGNEKYYYLDSNLPTNSENLGHINFGDIMLYDSNCLVLFYDSFSTPYSYTRMGYIEDSDGLADALGGRNVQVTFEKELN
jgi:hypothetical protein